MTRPGLSAFLRDPFFLACLLLALPVWLWIYFTPLPSLAGRSFTPLQFLLLGLVFPLLEELAFRGLVQGHLLRIAGLSRRTCLVTRANAITSLLFAAAHLLHQPPWIAALILLPSLLFGEMRDRYASTRPSIALHVYYNLGLLLILIYKPA